MKTFRGSPDANASGGIREAMECVTQRHPPKQRFFADDGKSGEVVNPVDVCKGGARFVQDATIALNVPARMAHQVSQDAVNLRW